MLPGQLTTASGHLHLFLSQAAASPTSLTGETSYYPLELPFPSHHCHPREYLETGKMVGYRQKAMMLQIQANALGSLRSAEQGYEGRVASHPTIPSGQSRVYKLEVHPASNVY